MSCCFDLPKRILAPKSLPELKSEMEKKIGLTFDKLKKECIQEIHQRDAELDKLKKEMQVLRAENTEIKEQRDMLKSAANQKINQANTELEAMWNMHQDALKLICKNDLNELKLQNEKLTEEKLFSKFCEEVFTFKNIFQYHLPIDPRKYPSDEELAFKIQKMSDHQLALLALASERNFSREKFSQLIDVLEKKNICILKQFIKQFACRSAKAIVPKFLAFLDGHCQPRQYGPYYNIYGDIEDDSGMGSDHEYAYGAEFIDLYNFKFELCGNCDCFHPEYCWYSRITLEEI